MKKLLAAQEDAHQRRCATIIRLVTTGDFEQAFQLAHDSFNNTSSNPHKFELAHLLLQLCDDPVTLYKHKEALIAVLNLHQHSLYRLELALERKPELAPEDGEHITRAAMTILNTAPLLLKETTDQEQLLVRVYTQTLPLLCRVTMRLLKQGDCSLPNSQSSINHTVSGIRTARSLLAGSANRPSIMKEIFSTTTVPLSHVSRRQSNLLIFNHKSRDISDKDRLLLTEICTAQCIALTESANLHKPYSPLPHPQKHASLISGSRALAAAQNILPQTENGQALLANISCHWPPEMLTLSYSLGLDITAATESLEQCNPTDPMLRSRRQNLFAISIECQDAITCAANRLLMRPVLSPTLIARLFLAISHILKNIPALTPHTAKALSMTSHLYKGWAETLAQLSRNTPQAIPIDKLLTVYHHAYKKSTHPELSIAILHQYTRIIDCFFASPIQTTDEPSHRFTHLSNVIMHSYELMQYPHPAKVIRREIKRKYKHYSHLLMRLLHKNPTLKRDRAYSLRLIDIHYLWLNRPPLRSKKFSASSSSEARTLRRTAQLALLKNFQRQSATNFYPLLLKHLPTLLTTKSGTQFIYPCANALLQLTHSLIEESNDNKRAQFTSLFQRLSTPLLTILDRAPFLQEVSDFLRDLPPEHLSLEGWQALPAALRSQGYNAETRSKFVNATPTDPAYTDTKQAISQLSASQLPPTTL